MATLLLLFTISLVCFTSAEWSTNTSSLVLLQIIHRHGDRTPLKGNFFPNDPFKNESNWSLGYGQLTSPGRYRMWQLGKSFKGWYADYLKQKVESPKKIYVRSSIEHRCIESVSHFLAGFYPPEGDWKWSNVWPGHTPAELGNNWLAIPIETFMPKENDTLLVPDKKCPSYDEIKKTQLQNEDVIKMKNRSKDIIDYIKRFYSVNITDFHSAVMFYDSLLIENEFNKTWKNDNRTHAEEVMTRLKPYRDWAHVWTWRIPEVNRLRAGRLVRTIVTNMNETIAGKNKKTVHIYSTHDSMMSVLMHALDIYKNASNNQTDFMKSIPDYGATLAIELHKDSGKYFVKMFYVNNTDKPDEPNEEVPEWFKKKKNNDKLWFDVLYNETSKVFVADNEFDQLCGLKTEDDRKFLLALGTFTAIGFVAGVLVVGLFALVCFIRRRKSRKYGDY